MNTLIILIAIVILIIGLTLSISTIINTRKKYYNNYLKGKTHEDT